MGLAVLAGGVVEVALIAGVKQYIYISADLETFIIAELNTAKDENNTSQRTPFYQRTPLYIYAVQPVG